ncbi:MAG: DM13 domain-containing protein [Leptolyngbyaceae cyanobacterium bins.302]|nr:DM13 domain-containing protein [Leptolyngbyaceae cyanobacterium bins.302]
MQNHLNQLTVKHLRFAPVLVSTLAIAGGAIRVAQALPQMDHSSGSSTHAIVAQKSSAVAFTGTFVKAEAPTSGTARIVTNGKHRFLEIDSAFKTTDQAPDLHVVLEPSATPPKTYGNPGQFINLGKLQKISGSQRYPIPDSINVANYKSVVIWCRMANATIGYASLKSSGNASR